MQKLYKLLPLLLILSILFSACNTTNPPALEPPDITDTADVTDTQGGTLPENDCDHTDADDNGKCDTCRESVIVAIDLYAINDLHGKFKDTDSNGGVDELTTYFKNRYSMEDNVVLLSSGDMWQGSSESNLTKGMIITEWMNHLDFASMTLGNHEYDWGEEYIEANDALADFPFLAINVYDRDTNERADYCDASVVVERDGIEIGIIGAIGDCYSSISGEQSGGFYIKTGSDLTSLVKAESERLRDEGVDYIVYSIHDGYGQNKGSTTSVSSAELASYYDTSLSDGYVDLVFEGHTHQRYVLIDEHGVYHLQNGGENKGISHVELRINSVTSTSRIKDAEFIEASLYENMADDTIVAELLEKYKDDIAIADEVLGNNAYKRNSSQICSLVAELYYEFGLEMWGDEYDIVLGGGFISTRSPYDLAAGEVKYSQLQSILPFDNRLVLCSVKGSDLKRNFFETSNKNYYIYYGEYGAEVKNSIDSDATYYIITDTYTSTYAYNRLTEVARYDMDFFARDLVADFIKNGGWAK